MTNDRKPVPLSASGTSIHSPAASESGPSTVRAGDGAAAPAPAAQPSVTVSEHEGVLYLHLGTEWIQGAMRLRKPDAIEIEYVQQMMMWLLFEPQPRHIVQLGLGAAALTKFCYRRFPAARVTAVELNPAVISICRSTFGLPADDARLSVLEMDALDFVLDPANRGSIDILQVDLYDAEAHAPVWESSEFYQACADCLGPNGMMTVNLFGDFVNYAKNLDAIGAAFDAVVWLPEVHDANVVAIGFKHAPAMEFSALYQRAESIRRSMQLPARTWVDGLKIWMREQASDTPS